MGGLARGIRGFGAVGASLAVLGLCGSSEVRAEQGDPTILGTCAGQDWSLSEKIEPLPDTGLFTMGAESDHDIVAHRGHTLTWAELNPAKGVYDWAPVEKLLSRAERDDYGVVLRLKSSVVDRRSPWGDLAAVPQWVLDETDPPIARVRDRGRKNYTDIVVPWDEHVQAAYLEFVRAFGEQGFHRHRRLLGLYVHGISTSWGEEFWLDEGAVAALQPHGLSPERLRETFGARIEAWAHAFGAEAGRLAWVGTGWIAAGKEWRTYRKMGNELDAHALALGLGQRWGHNEAYNKRLDQSGQELSRDGVLRTNPDFPMLAEGRYWGGENEIWKGRRSEAFDYRRATLRAMQMQMRLLWVNDAGISLDPEIARYFTQVAGRTPANAPDAWAVLRETEVRVGSKPQKVGNLERWLYQVQPPDAPPTPRLRPVERAPQSKDWGRPVEWTARSAAAGGGRFDFELDPGFVAAAPGEDLLVQVSWIDEGGAQWHLESGPASARLRSQRVEASGDGREKTTLVRVPSLAPTPDASDLALVPDAGELLVSRVRVLKPDALGEAFRSCAGGGQGDGGHG